MHIDQIPGFCFCQPISLLDVYEVIGGPIALRSTGCQKSATNIYEYLRILKFSDIHEYLRILNPQVTNTHSMLTIKETGMVMHGHSHGERTRGHADSDTFKSIVTTPSTGTGRDWNDNAWKRTRYTGYGHEHGHELGHGLGHGHGH